MTTQAKQNRHRCRKRIATATWLCQQHLKAPWTVPAAPVGGPSNPAAWCRIQGAGGMTPPDKQTHIPGVEAASTCSVASVKLVGRISQSSSPHQWHHRQTRALGIACHAPELVSPSQQQNCKHELEELHVMPQSLRAPEDTCTATP